MEKTAMQLCSEAQFKEWVEEKVPDEVWEMVNSSESTMLDMMLERIEKDRISKMGKHVGTYVGKKLGA